MTSMTRGEPGERPDGDDVGGRAEIVFEEGAGDGRFDVDIGPVDHAGEDGGDADVEDGADGERDDDADGHVALRVLGFLRGGGDGVEADVGEEDQARGEADAAYAEGREGVPVRCPSWPC